MAILARVPSRSGAGLDLKVAKAIDTLANRIHIPVAVLTRRLNELRGQARRQAASATARAGSIHEESAPIDVLALDRKDLELIRILLNDPAVVESLITRVTVISLRDEPLRAILQASYDVLTGGDLPTFDLVATQLHDPAMRDLAAGLIGPIDPAPMNMDGKLPPTEIRLERLLAGLANRERLERIRDLRTALSEIDQESSPDEYLALHLELKKLSRQRPDTRHSTAS
jgi:DNA primase